MRVFHRAVDVLVQEGVVKFLQRWGAYCRKHLVAHGNDGGPVIMTNTILAEEDYARRAAEMRAARFDDPYHLKVQFALCHVLAWFLWRDGA